jgi:hypothetical protein
MPPGLFCTRCGLLDRSPVTIQKIELNKLTLAQSLAQEISNQTGVSLEWLLKNDVNAPIVDIRGEAYTSKSFQEFQAAALWRKVPAVGIMESTHMGVTARRRIDSLILRAYKSDAIPLLAYRLSAALSVLEKDFGVTDADAKAVTTQYTESMMTKIKKERALIDGYERQAFFHAMGAESKRKGEKPFGFAELIPVSSNHLPDGQVKYYPGNPIKRLKQSPS